MATIKKKVLQEFLEDVRIEIFGPKTEKSKLQKYLKKTLKKVQKKA